MYHGVRTCMSVQLTRKNYSCAEEGEPGDKAKLQCPCSTVATYHSTCMSVQLTRTNYILAHRGEPVDKAKLQCPCSTVHVATCMYHGVHVCLYNSSMYVCMYSSLFQQELDHIGVVVLGGKVKGSLLVHIFRGCCLLVVRNNQLRHLKSSVPRGYVKGRGLVVSLRLDIGSSADDDALDDFRFSALGCEM